LPDDPEVKRTNGRENPDKEGKEETQKGQKVILLFNSFLSWFKASTGWRP